MATIIPADKWNFDQAKINTGFQPNNGCVLTTEAILESMKEINSRPETKEFFDLIKKSDQYITGRVVDGKD